MYGVTNDEAKAAKKLFESREGIDILPPAAVAVAALMQACERGLNKGRRILLNITGGGYERLKREIPLYPVKPVLNVSGPDVPLEEILKVIEWPTLSKTL